MFLSSVFGLPSLIFVCCLLPLFSFYISPFFINSLNVMLIFFSFFIISHTIYLIFLRVANSSFIRSCFICILWSFIYFNLFSFFITNSLACVFFINLMKHVLLPSFIALSILTSEGIHFFRIFFISCLRIILSYLSIDLFISITIYIYHVVCFFPLSSLSNLILILFSHLTILFLMIIF